MKKQKDQAKMLRMAFLGIYQTGILKKGVLGNLTAEGVKVSQSLQRKTPRSRPNGMAGRALRFCLSFFSKSTKSLTI